MAEAIYVHDGQAIDYTPGSDVAPGDVVVLGDLVGIAKTQIKADALGALAVVGVFDIAKETGLAFSIGAVAYWDNTNKVAVATDDSGANKRLGRVVATAATADATVRVRLD